MHYVIINASPHTTSLSNTAQVIDSFQQGIKNENSTVEIYHLSQKKHWKSAKSAFLTNENIVFALPVFAATIPGFFMEFLEELYLEISEKRKSPIKHNISFLIQSGFPESCQRINCENLLKTIPGFLNSNFSGILSYGINARFAIDRSWTSVLDNFENIGELFVRNNGNFFFEQAENFNTPELLSENEAKKFNKLFNFFCRQISESKGCNISLKDKPYLK
ncbi:MAG: NAD(P)H-dependent oxidoreductase [Clostridia bacterium]|nr:NAD(P)H-dependent oxidoreductase [Clostridia bacterium]